MKKLLFIAVSLACTFICQAQKKSVDISTDPSGNPLYYSASAPNSDEGLAVTIDKSTKWIEYRNAIPNQPLTNYVFMEGAKKIGLSMFIPKDSVQSYRYSIIENDKHWLVSNATPNIISKSFHFQNRVHIDLGTFNIESRKLTIETYKLTERNKVSTVTIYNKPIKPATLSLTTFYVTNKKGQEGVEMKNMKDGFKFKIDDTLHVNSIFLSIKPSDLTFIYHVYLKELSSGKIVPLLNNWIYGYLTNNQEAYPYILIDATYFKNPGNYEIIILPKLSSGFNARSFPAKATTIRFTVLKSASVFSQKEMFVWGTIMIIIVGSIAGLIIYFIKKNNQQKLLREQQQKDFAQMQLSAVRSQLNPHFMFNALSGIQNLMNKNDVDQANRYLTKFSRLTRSVLKNTDLISLAEEKVLLDDYLQMEQLRFNFEYDIELDPQFNPDNIEIPAMLLQPFVENAVKHGVAGLGDKGYINIRMIKQDNSILIYITDNGKGFDATKKNNGLGLSLSKKRIALLNSIYKSSPIVLDIKSDEGNTTISITLNYWL